MRGKYTYELLALFAPDLLDNEKAEFQKWFNDFIKTEKGQVNQATFWELQKLAYKVKSYNDGFYFLAYFDVDTDRINELNSELFLYKKLLRHMIVKVPQEYRYKKFDIVFEKDEPRKSSYGGSSSFVPFDGGRKVVTEEKKIRKQEEDVATKDVLSDDPKKDLKDKIEDKTDKKKKDESLEDKLSVLDKQLDDIVKNPDRIIDI